jgi:DNA-binding ferritin-like protein
VITTLLLDEQGDQLYAMTDPLAERVRKVGGTTLRSIGTLHASNASRTTMPFMSHRKTCWRNCARIMQPWRQAA